MADPYSLLLYASLGFGAVSIVIAVIFLAINKRTYGRMKIGKIDVKTTSAGVFLLAAGVALILVPIIYYQRVVKAKAESKALHALTRTQAEQIRQLEQRAEEK